MFLIACFAVALGASGAGANTAEAPAACTPAGSKVIEQTRQALIFERRGNLWGCVFEDRQPVNLAARLDNEFWYRRPAIKMRGSVVAYALTARTDPNEGVEATLIQRVDLRSSTDPKFRYFQSKRAGPGVPKVGSLVFRSSGAVAWIACPGRHASRGMFAPTCERPGASDRVYVLRRGARKPELIDTGSRIDPHSLRLHGSRITWLKRGRTVSAAL